jgi:hypothetical protein
MSMRSLRTVAFLIVVLSVACTPALAQPSVSGEGVVQGTVYATGSYGVYVPLGWVTITASNSKYNFTTSTDGNGFYVLNLPVGTYKLTVQVSVGGFGVSQTVSITATNGSVVHVDFDFTVGDVY